VKSLVPINNFLLEILVDSGKGCDETSHWPHRPHRQEITAPAPKTTNLSMAAAADDWTLALALTLTLTLELVVLGAGAVISCRCGW